jgi:hypothetical protein
MEISSKTQKLNTGFSKPTELPEDTDYRGIAGSASLNATSPEEHSDSVEKGATSDETGENNPLVRGI